MKAEPSLIYVQGQFLSHRDICLRPSRVCDINRYDFDINRYDFALFIAIELLKLPYLLPLNY